MTTTMVVRLAALMLALAACGTELQLSATKLIQLQVSPPSASTAAGLSQKLAATAIYQDGHTQDVSSQATWTSLDVAIASVDADGLVTTAAAGSTRVVASLLGMTAFADLAVTEATLLSLEVAPDLRQVPLGAAVKAVARGRLTDASTVDLTSVATWSTPLGGLTILTPGVARARAVGPARLCARFRGLQGFVDLDVTSAAATRLQVSAARDLASLPKGTVAALTVRAFFTDGTELDVTADTSWSTDQPGVALVEEGGVRGLSRGSAQLEAGYQGQTVSVAVTVTTAELVGLALSPPEALAPCGGFVELTALGSYSDGTVGDVTDLVAWNSIDPLEVEMSGREHEAGHAFGLLNGEQSVVTALLPGTSISATSLIRVDDSCPE